MHNEEGRELVLALEGMFRLFMTATTAGELSLSAASVLGRLARHGPLRLTELAQAENVSQPAMTQLVTRLERDLLARRSPDRSDGRAVLVEVTAAGRRVLERRREERATVMSHLLSGLDRADRAVITAAIPALQRLGTTARAASAPSGAVPA